MKKILTVIGMVVLVLAVAGGSFYGGIAYQRNQLARTRAAFQSGGGFPGNGTNQGGTGGNFPGGFGGTVTGQVKSFDGTSLQVSTARDVTTVHFDDSTRIEMAASATATDLQAGARVIIIGQRDSSGVLTASEVLIISAP